MRNLMVLFLTIYSYLFSGNHSDDQTYIKLDTIELICFYDVIFRPDSTDMNFILKEEFTVFLGSEIIQSQSSNFLSRLSYIKDDDLAGLLSAMATGNIPSTHFTSVHYINYPAGKITALDNIGIEEYKYTMPMKNVDWIILPESKKIGHFSAHKALTLFGGREWVAWFTTEIPYNAGPYLFHGLPGLILKISDTQSHYTFELSRVSIPENFKYIEIKDKPRTNISKKDFFRLCERFDQNPIGEMKQSFESTGATIVFHNPADAERHARQTAHRRNNPIELKAD